MATAADAVQAAQETARLGISAVVEAIATGMMEIGPATPHVASLCVALLKAEEVVDGASRNKEELEQLWERCRLITVQVIDKAKASNTPAIDVMPLQICVDELKEVAERYRNRGRWGSLALFPREGNDIQRLRARIEAVVPIMQLSGVNNGEMMGQLLARLQPGPKLAPVPKSAPVTKSYHVVRHGVVDRVCNILGGDGGPAVAALIGGSGAGKTASAASMIGERGDRLRALFPDGVVWLRVGKEAGAAARLPRLMHHLGKKLHQDVMKSKIRVPEAFEDSESYVKEIVSRENLKCLVVADDVWDPSVVQKLRGTGMWVLLTTRFPEMVEPNEMVFMDTLTTIEAEGVLRGAAMLPPDERLSDAAHELLKICGHVAMDTEFVGSWTGHVEIARKKDAWARAVKSIRANGGGVGVEKGVNRVAILRAGFDYLGAEDVSAPQLFAELAVFPDGHAFGESDAAVLLGEEVATKSVSILERWGVLKVDAPGKYRMHDAHADFARDKLMGWEHVRGPAVERWTKHISRLNVAAEMDVYALLRMWQALEKVGGGGWWVTRPYDDQLVKMDASDPSKSLAVDVVAELYEHSDKFSEVEPLMKRVLEHGDAHGSDSPEVQMVALYHSWICLVAQGRDQEGDDVERRLGELGGPGLQIPLPSDGTGFLQASTTFNTYGVCMKAAGRSKDAEELFRKALTAQETGGLTSSNQNVWTMLEFGRLGREAGRLGEAETWFRQALEIREAKLGADDLLVAHAMNELGLCVREAGRSGEAETWFRRALEIKEATLGANDRSNAVTLHELGLCVREAGRSGEAESLFLRALEIKEATLGPDAPSVAVTLHEMGLCVREAGRPGEAESLFRRALGIKEATLGVDNRSVAVTLHELGLCMGEAGRSDEAESLFRRALEIKEAKLGADDRSVAVTLEEAGWSGEAESLFRRALEINGGNSGALEDVERAIHAEFHGRFAPDAESGGTENRWELDRLVSIAADLGDIVVQHTKSKDETEKELALQPFAQAYYTAVRTGICNTYLAACVVKSSWVSTGKTGRIGKAGKAMNLLSSIPVIGGIARPVGTALKAGDGYIQTRRLEKICSLAPDAVECCSLARKLGLRLTDSLPDDATSMIDEADEVGVQATASTGGGAGASGSSQGIGASPQDETEADEQEEEEEDLFDNLVEEVAGHEPADDGGRKLGKQHVRKVLKAVWKDCLEGMETTEQKVDKLLQVIIGETTMCPTATSSVPEDPLVQPPVVAPTHDADLDRGEMATMRAQLKALELASAEKDKVIKKLQEQVTTVEKRIPKPHVESDGTMDVGGDQLLKQRQETKTRTKGEFWRDAEKSGSAADWLTLNPDEHQAETRNTQAHVHEVDNRVGILEAQVADLREQLRGKKKGR